MRLVTSHGLIWSGQKLSLGYECNGRLADTKFEPKVVRKLSGGESTAFMRQTEMVRAKQDLSGSLAARDHGVLSLSKGTISLRLRPRRDQYVARFAVSINTLNGVSICACRKGVGEMGCG